MKELNGIFVKFSCHTNDIMNGQLYCKNLDFYRTVESEEESDGLKDKEEGVWRDTTIHRMNPIFQCTKKTTKYVDGQNTFLFCVTNLEPSYNKDDESFYQLSEEQCQNFKRMYTNNKTHKLDPVGNVVITKPDDFTLKIEEACKKKNIGCFHSLVAYTKEKNSESLSSLRESAEQQGNKLPDSLLACFIKNDRYSWQMEYRFLFYDVPKDLIEGDHLNLEIGKLKIMTTEGRFLAYENIEAFPKDMNAFIK